MYTVALNELKAILVLCAKAGKGDVVNKTSTESMALYDGFREVKTQEAYL
jgi:hypothetical protein